MTKSDTSPLTQFHAEIERLLDKTAQTRYVHSLLLAVRTDDGEIDIRTAAGIADPGDAYYIASITKMFTATIIMQLIDEQQMNLNDRLVDLLPHLSLNGIHHHKGSDHTPNIKLRHLLHQTSGLPDYFAGGLDNDFKQNLDPTYTLHHVLEIARATPAKFAPGDRDGTRSFYSDTNYQLLTAIIETSTGDTYGNALQHRIARPLALTNTYLAGQDLTTPRHEPLNLYNKNQPLHLPNALASEQGAGGIISTLDDQLRFTHAYHHGELFDPGHTAAMHQWNRVFFPVKYGHGVMRYQLPRWMTAFRRSTELIGHSGASNSFAFYAPELRCHIVGTLNQLDNPSRAFRLMSSIANLVQQSAADSQPHAVLGDPPNSKGPS